MFPAPKVPGWSCIRLRVNCLAGQYIICGCYALINPGTTGRLHVARMLYRIYTDRKWLPIAASDTDDLAQRITACRSNTSVIKMDR